MTAVIEAYTVRELHEQPIRTEDVLMIMVSSGVECGESWEECNDTTKNLIRNAMNEAIQVLSGSKIEETEEGPIITA